MKLSVAFCLLLSACVASADDEATFAPIAPEDDTFAPVAAEAPPTDAPVAPSLMPVAVATPSPSSTPEDDDTFAPIAAETPPPGAPVAASPMPANAVTPDPTPLSGGNTAPGVCFMLYQMADNDLEWFIRADLKEYTDSSAVSTSTTTSWVYHDGRNFGTQDETKEPLQNVFTSDGSQTLFEARGETGKTQGSQYLTYRHDLGKMVQERVLPGETNSDTVGAIQSFVTTALTDCVAKGSREFFVAFSSHGGGFNGFGGDEHTRSRHLSLQPNSNLRQALQNSLSSVPGAPSKFDAIGFDACLMQSFEALDDYHDITKYFLGSEAVEPGHGKRCPGQMFFSRILRGKMIVRLLYL